MEEMKTSEAPKNERFKSRFGAIMSAIGFTVGIGALWGTPMYISKNGGGFAIIMLVGLSTIIAIPLAVIEFGIGRKTRKTILTGMQSIVGKKSPFNAMGWIGATAGMLLASSFIILNALVVYYFYYALTGKLNDQPVETHQAIYDSLFYNGPMMVVMAIIIAVLYIWVNGQNVAKGLERVCKIMVPSLLGLIILMDVWNLIQPGGINGLVWFLTPDFSVVNSTMLGEALWTVFLMSPVGYSFAWAYGSYMPGEGSEGDIPVNSTVIVLADCCTGILVGLSIFPAMFAAGIDVKALQGLSFYAGIPLTFDKIPGGHILVIIFFLYSCYPADPEFLMYYVVSNAEIERFFACAFCCTACAVHNAHTGFTRAFPS
jgi:NSS family neurotransmitter:Na+ symporter